MPEPGRLDATEAEISALRRGRGEGLAIAALVIGLLGFINLLGVEKGILAVVLGVLALRSAATGATRRQSWIAVTLGAVQIATVAIVLVLFREKLSELLDLLKTLG